MLECEREIRGYLNSCNGSGGDIQLILDAVVELAHTDRLRYETLRRAISKTCGIRASILDAEVLPGTERPEQAGTGLVFTDPEPCNEPVDGAGLLDQISAWLSRYVVLPAGAADAIAAWVVATWFRDRVYFAPILAALSPTKRAGKTLLLDLLRQLTYRGQLTSGTGITPAVLFRLNEEWHPTFLIDEAEKLSHIKEGMEMIGLLNAGTRRGGTVQRCAGDDHHVENFDAFGFRAVAAIGKVWDTLLDRSVVIRMQRKSAGETVDRFNARLVETEGKVLAGRIVRWVTDNLGEVADAEASAPRPEWLNDRACDNWSPLFGIGSIANGGWVERLLQAAKKLEAGKDEEDRGERLILDIQSLFHESGDPEVLSSGELVERLRAIEDAPWGEYRGSGLTPHKLAYLLRKFAIKPRHNHSAQMGKDLRGYWLKDLELVFSRYSRSQSVRSVRSLNNQSLSGNQSVRSHDDGDAVSYSKQRDMTVLTLQSVRKGAEEEKTDNGAGCLSCWALTEAEGEPTPCALHAARSAEVPF